MNAPTQSRDRDSVGTLSPAEAHTLAEGLAQLRLGMEMLEAAVQEVLSRQQVRRETD